MCHTLKMNDSRKEKNEKNEKKMDFADVCVGVSESHRQECAVLASGRERTFGHLRRHVPRQRTLGRDHHPAGRRGRQLLRPRPGRSRGN